MSPALVAGCLWVIAAAVTVTAPESAPPFVWTVVLSTCVAFIMASAFAAILIFAMVPLTRYTIEGLRGVPPG